MLYGSNLVIMLESIYGVCFDDLRSLLSTKKYGFLNILPSRPPTLLAIDHASLPRRRDERSRMGKERSGAMEQALPLVIRRRSRTREVQIGNGRKSKRISEMISLRILREGSSMLVSITQRISQAKSWLVQEEGRCDQSIRSRIGRDNPLCRE